MNAPKFTVARSALRDALAKVVPVTESGRSSLLVRTHVLIAVDGEGATLTGTNFDAFVRVVMPCNAQTPGRVLLPAKRLSEIAANLPDGTSPTITVAQNVATITAGRSRFEVVGLPVEEFPLVPVVEGEAATIPAKVFVDAVTRCLRHASTEESRPALWAVHISPVNGQLVATATTGHHLLRMPLAGVTGMAECSIHTGSVPVLTKLFGGLGADATLSVTTDGSRLLLASSSATAVLPLNDHRFPAVEPILRQSVQHTVVCDRAALLASFARVSLGTGEDERIECTLNGTVTLSAANDRQRAEDVLELDSHEGEGELRFALNAGWVRTILANLTDERVRLTFGSATTAVHFRNASQSPDDPTIALAMTLRTF